MAAHDITAVPRTKDIELSENVEFKDMCLSEKVLKGLNEAGFVRPSPVQLKSIPVGRCGLDMIVQAKSGTGKTCVYCVTTLENISFHNNNLQAMVICPTREIAMQGAEVMKSVGKYFERLQCHTFIGGLPVQEDRKKLESCRIAIGTPGRVKQLIEEKVLVTDHIRIFILDEADKLMEDFLDSIKWIYSFLSKTKQMIALSATFPESMTKSITNFMNSPTAIRLNSTDPALLGIRQYYKVLERYPLDQQNFVAKICCLISILEKISFQQCLVFSNNQPKAEAFAKYLSNKGWPATHISGSLNQDNRISAISRLQKFECRILVTTDLTSRGIDVQNVNLVINLDIPKDHETYLHRIGRAGRFGSYGAAISIALEGNEMSDLMKFAEVSQAEINRLPDLIPENLAECSSGINVNKLVSTQILGDETMEIKKILEETEKLTDTVKLVDSNICEKSTKSQTARGQVKKRVRKKMTATDLKNSLQKESCVNNNLIDSPRNNKDLEENNFDNTEDAKIDFAQKSRKSAILDGCTLRESSQNKSKDKLGDNELQENFENNSGNYATSTEKIQLKRFDNEKENKNEEIEEEHKKILSENNVYLNRKLDEGELENENTKTEVYDEEENCESVEESGDNIAEEEESEDDEDVENKERNEKEVSERYLYNYGKGSKIDRSEIEEMNAELDRLTIKVHDKDKRKNKKKSRYNEDNYMENDYFCPQTDNQNHWYPTSRHINYDYTTNYYSQPLQSNPSLSEALWDHGLRFSYWMGINYGYYLAYYESLKNQYGKKD